MTAPRSSDRRVRRTHEALRDALLELLAERVWDGIDVQSLCERADVGRSTFYQHFANKEELLGASLAGLRERLLRTAAPGTDPLPFLDGLLAHVQEQRAVFRALLGRRSGWFVQERFRALLAELFHAALLSAAGDSLPAWELSARAHCLGGALFELLAWWLGTPQAQDAAEVGTLFRRLCRGAMPGRPDGVSVEPVGR